MEQLNRIELKGIVGNVRIQTFDESRMARIGLATNYAYKDRDGAAVIDTSWHNIIAVPELYRGGRRRQGRYR